MSQYINNYKHLIGQSFCRNGIHFTVVKCEGATVLAAFLENRRMTRILVPLSDVLDSLDEESDPALASNA